MTTICPCSDSHNGTLHPRSQDKKRASFTCGFVLSLTSCCPADTPLYIVVYTAFTRSLTCINRFGDDLAVSALSDSFKLSTISASQSAFCLFTFEPAFFSRYKVTAKTKPDETLPSARFILLGKTLHDIFKQQAVSSANRITLTIPAKDFSRAEEAANDNQATPSGCRLTVIVFCPHGVKKTYRLTYQAGDSMIAIATKDNCPNRFTASPRVIKDWTDYFMLGRHGTDEITFWCTRNSCKIRSFEGAQEPHDVARPRDSASLSKQSISTTLSVETGEFDSYNLETDEALITVTLKELKAIIDYAINIGNSIDFYFSTGGQPLLTEFETDNLSVSFVMSTNGDDPAGIQREKQDVKPRMTQSRLGSIAANGVNNSRQASKMPPGSSNRGVSGRLASQRLLTSTPSTAPPAHNKQPLFRPRDTQSPEANAQAPIKLDDDDDDDSLWAELDAADPSFTQEALRLEGPPVQPDVDTSADIGLEMTFDSTDDVRNGKQASSRPATGEGGEDNEAAQDGPDIIDMSLDDDTEESVLLSGRSKRPRMVSGCI